MKLILLIAFRNIFRQKSRSILIGIGICVSVIITIVGHSFSKGISLNAVNNAVEANLLGHFTVMMVEKNGDVFRNIIRDKNEITAAIKKHLDNVRYVRESVRALVFAVGNGQGRVIGLTGFPKPYENMLKELSMVEGDLNKIASSEIENPLILEHSLAKSLNIKVGDIVKIRLNTIYGQVQTARLNLIAIAEIKNPVMKFVFQGILPLKSLKSLLGYQENEAQRLNVILNKVDNSRDIITYADELHRKLRPVPVSIKGMFTVNEYNSPGIITGLLSQESSQEILSKHMNLIQGQNVDIGGMKGNAIINKSLAKLLNLTLGEKVSFSYKLKNFDHINKLDFHVAGIIDDLADNSYVAFLNEKEFYSTYLESRPKEEDNSLFNKDSSLTPFLSYSWKVAERTYSAQALGKKERERRRNETFNGPIIDIVTMQEIANDLFRMESTINLISMIAMLVILSITLTSLLNAVRMNIRERTREIGTIRAVGMQKRLVSSTLLTEIGLLSFFASLSGIIVSYLLMHLISMITFTTSDINFSIMLDNGHLNFVPAFNNIIIYIVFIILISIFAAYFPIKKAVKMSVSEALVHYE